MKATGIVRRIDDLGRVVIPKEIRRTLRIRDGDPLEIFTERDGEVIFKKYSPIGELTDFAGQFCESIGRTTGRIAVITDRDGIIAVSGAPKRELLEKRNSSDLEELMEQRHPYSWREGERKHRIADGAERYHIAAFAPILTAGDLMGSVSILAEEKDGFPGDMEQKVVQTVATFLGRHMET